VLQGCSLVFAIVCFLSTSVATQRLFHRSLQHFYNITATFSFFFFSACARDYSDYLHRNTLSQNLLVTLLRSCLCIWLGIAVLFFFGTSNNSLSFFLYFFFLILFVCFPICRFFVHSNFVVDACAFFFLLCFFGRSGRS
jgi:hypothetical protein